MDDRLFPVSDVFSKYGFNDTGVGSSLAIEVAEMLDSYGYQASTVDACSHCIYIDEVITPDGRDLGYHREDDPDILALLDKHFPFKVSIYEASYGLDTMEHPFKKKGEGVKWPER